MSHSPLLGATAAPARTAGKSVATLGPSDSSDSGSDVQGEAAMATGADNAAEWGALTTAGDNDSDALGTGERASASGDAGRDGADILPDRVISPRRPASGPGSTDAMGPLDDDDGVLAEFDDLAAADLAADDAAAVDDAPGSPFDSPSAPAVDGQPVVERRRG